MDCTCCRCGKVFDYEKYYGICPKCAAYNKRGGTQDNYNIDKAFTARYDVKDDSCKDLHERYDSASAHQPQKQHAEYHKAYDTAQMPQSHYGQQQSYQGQARSYQGTQQYGTTQKTKKKSSGVKWIVILFVIVFILFVALAIYASNRERINKALGIGVMDEPPKRVDVLNGTSISMDGLDLSVDEILILGDSNNISVVPSGEMLLAVHADIISDGGKNSRKFEAPMLYCDGVYRECLSDYEAEYTVLPLIQDTGITSDNLLSEYLYMNYTDTGYFLFIVPADAEDILVVIEEKKKSDSDRVVSQYWIKPSVQEWSTDGQLTLEQEVAE